jgi:hypothetical protein
MIPISLDLQSSRPFDPFVLYPPPLFDSPAVASISYNIVGIAKTLKMGISRQASHPISLISGTSQASDIIVDPAV